MLYRKWKGPTRNGLLAFLQKAWRSARLPHEPFFSRFASYAGRSLADRRRHAQRRGLRLSFFLLRQQPRRTLVPFLVRVGSDPAAGYRPGRR